MDQKKNLKKKYSRPPPFSLLKNKSAFLVCFSGKSLKWMSWPKKIKNVNSLTKKKIEAWKDGDFTGKIVNDNIIRNYERNKNLIDLELLTVDHTTVFYN